MLALLEADDAPEIAMKSIPQEELEGAQRDGVRRVAVLHFVPTKQRIWLAGDDAIRTMVQRYSRMDYGVAPDVVFPRTV
jgi:hypothetical protein